MKPTYAPTAMFRVFNPASLMTPNTAPTGREENMKTYPKVMWQIIAAEYETAAEEHYGLWMDYTFHGQLPEAGCEWRKYKESLAAARKCRQNAKG